MARIALLPVAALLVVVAVQGCGGDSGSTRSEVAAFGAIPVHTSSLSKAQFIARAEGICRRAGKNLLSLFAAYMKAHPWKSRQAKEIVAENAVRHVVLEKYGIEVAEIGRIGAPSGDERQVGELLAAMRHAARLLDARAKLPAALKEVDREFAEAHELATAYGLSNCVD